MGSIPTGALKDWDKYMGRKPGIQNIPKGEAQEKVLLQLEQGSTITAAMASVGRNDVTFRQWSMNDPDFKDRADKARLKLVKASSLT
jgi:hypothetical protein